MSLARASAAASEAGTPTAPPHREQVKVIRYALVSPTPQPCGTKDLGERIGLAQK